MQDLLAGLPLYAEYVPDAAAERGRQALGLWSRPTTPWSLECDATHPKQGALDALRAQAEAEDGAERGRAGNAYAAVVATIGAPGLAFLTYRVAKSMLAGKKEKRWAAMNAIATVLWSLLGVALVGTAAANARGLWAKMSKVKELDGYLGAGCSDSYTVMPDDLIGPLYWQLYLGYAWLGASLLITGLALANFLVSVRYARKRARKAAQIDESRLGKTKKQAPARGLQALTAVASSIPRNFRAQA